MLAKQDPKLRPNPEVDPFEKPELSAAKLVGKSLIIP